VLALDVHGLYFNITRLSSLVSYWLEVVAAVSLRARVISLPARYRMRLDFERHVLVLTE
jgi:hypothetical protein